MSSAAAGDGVDNAIHWHKAAVRIQRWFRLLVQRRRDCQTSSSHQSVMSTSERSPVSTGQQSVKQLLSAKREEMLRRRNDSSSISDTGDDKDSWQRKEEKARLARQHAIQVSFVISYLFLIYVFITFCVSRRRRKMYCGHARLCLCVSVHTRTPTLLHGPRCNLAAW